MLSSNHNAIHILEKNLDKINWQFLSTNTNIHKIEILNKNLEDYKYLISWYLLCGNYNAIHIIEKNKDKINWINISENPSIFELDYERLKQRCAIFKEELIQKVMHPSRIQKYLDAGYEIDDLDNYI